MPSRVRLGPACISTDQIEAAFAGLGKAEFFAGLVFEELSRMQGRPDLTVLDIGCGGGFHHRPDLQASIGAGASRFIGVEPDPQAQIQPVFAKLFRGTFEQSQIAPESVDLAYAVMVLEHVADPVAFFGQLARVLKPGGVFWGFTVDRRHWFAWLSAWSEALGIKNRYLDKLRGRRGDERYENFPTHYRCNTPRALRRLSGQSLRFETWSLHKIGQLDYYLPRAVWPVAHALDRFNIWSGLPGSVLALRATRLRTGSEPNRP